MLVSHRCSLDKAEYLSHCSQPLEEHGVTTVFVSLDNTKLELLEPLGESSPIANFLKQKPAGGIHHICIEVGKSALEQ